MLEGYISREAAVKAANEWVSEACMAPVMRISRLFDKLQKVPAADVAPVVYCRDCKHYDMGVCLKIYSDGNIHSAAWQKRKPDDFCSYGERKEGAEC